MDVRPIVVHESDLEREAWDDPVRGHLGFRVLLSGGVTPTAGLTTGLAYLAPGGWLGRHRHAPPEVYFVVEGEGTVFLDGVEHAVTAGSSVFVPGDVEHGIHNPGGSLLRFHYVFPVDSFTAVEYRFG
ncbi:MAG: cupin domain-containing protein [Kineosporiaceae bacterium]